MCIVTGGNQGIGYHVAKALVKKGMHVIIGKCFSEVFPLLTWLACRSKERGEEAVKNLSTFRKNAKVKFYYNSEFW